MNRRPFNNSAPSKKRPWGESTRYRRCLQTNGCDHGPIDELCVFRHSLLPLMTRVCSAQGMSHSAWTSSPSKRNRAPAMAARTQIQPLQLVNVRADRREVVLPVMGGICIHLHSVRLFNGGSRHLRHLVANSTHGRCPIPTSAQGGSVQNFQPDAHPQLNPFFRRVKVHDGVWTPPTMADFLRAFVPW